MQTPEYNRNTGLDPRLLRADAITMSHMSGGAHLASSLSCADLLAILYGEILKVDPAHPSDPDRDRFILSKGHAAAILYSALARRGYFPPGELETYGQPGGLLTEHPPAHGIPGVEVATGSLGHGLSMGVGMALAARIEDRSFRVFAVVSDGEMNEGSTWEAILFAAAQGLDRLCLIVDYNKWQATGRSEEILAISPLADKFAAFGWRVLELDGHDRSALRHAFHVFNSPDTRPTALVAHTVKGKGVSFMEDDNNWHYRVPTASELATALSELGLA